VTTEDHGGGTCKGGAKARSCVIDGLRDGTYTFTVEAENAKGTGEEATVSKVKVPGDLGPVRDLRYSMRSAKGQARVTWRKPFYDGGSAITHYEVKYRMQGSGEWKTLADAKTTTVLLKKLVPAETYDVKVLAVTKKDKGPESTTSGLIPKLPAAPRDVKAVPGDSKVTVTWSAPASSGTSAIKSYVVKSSVGKASCTVKATESTCVVTGLKNGTRYSFTVRARNSSGFGKPGVSKRVIPGKVPAVVQDLKVTITAGGEARMDWNKPASNGGLAVSTYVVSYAAEGEDGGSQTVKDTQATFTGLTSGVTYTFTVTAKNVYGSGPAAELTKSAP
jgi:titin